MNENVSDFEVMIQNLRTRLLDTTNRNKLISYKHTEKTKNNIRIVDISVAELERIVKLNEKIYFSPLPELEAEFPDEQNDKFELLLQAEKNSSKEWNKIIDEDIDLDSNEAYKVERELRDKVRQKLGLPIVQKGRKISISDWAKVNNINPDYNLPATDKHTIHNELQTLYLPEELDARLANIFDINRTSQQESGIGILYLAVGFLEWYESNDSEKPNLSPLMIYELEGEKTKTNANKIRYSITSINSKPNINSSLNERLKRDFNIILPDFDDDNDCNSYIEKIKKIIKEKKNWKIKNYATMAIFNFSRLVMYNDLNQQNWSNGILSSQGVLRDIFKTGEGSGNTPENYDLDKTEIYNGVPVFVLDADSSQHMAIIDGLKGKNLVIKGPPGTGKSQTITNLIAAGLSQNKKILFVAEKAAALDVVKKRLEQVGFGDFCLELHSTKTNKIKVLSSIEKRLKKINEFSGEDYEHAQNELDQIRDKLTKHAKIINEPFSNIEIYKNGTYKKATIHDLIWSEIKSRDYDINHSAVDGIYLHKCENITRFEISNVLNLLRQVEDANQNLIEKYQFLNNHPWYFIKNENLNYTNIDSIKILNTKIIESIENIIKLISEQNEFMAQNVNVYTISILEKCIQDLKNLKNIDTNINKNILKKLEQNEYNIQTVIVIINEIQQIINLEEKIKSLIGNSNIQMDDILHNAINSISNDWNLAAENIDSISQKINNLKIEKELFKDIKIEVEKFSNILNVRFEKINLDCIKDFIKINEHLKKFNRDVFVFRTPTLIDEASQYILIDMNKNLNSIKKMKEEISEYFDLNVQINSKDLRRYLDTLKNAGLFKIFNSDYKNAEREISPLVKSKFQNNSQLHKNLDCLVEIKQLEETFFRNDQYKNICSIHYNGLNTKIDTLFEVLEYNKITKEQFGITSQLEKSIREVLLSASMDTIDALANIFNTEKFQNIINYINENVYGIGINTNLDLINEKLEVLEDLKQKISKFDIKSKTTIKELLDLKSIQKNMNGLLKSEKILNFDNEFNNVTDYKKYNNDLIATVNFYNSSEYKNSSDLVKLPFINCAIDFYDYKNSMNKFLNEIQQHYESLKSNIQLLDNIVHLDKHLINLDINQISQKLKFSYSNTDDLSPWLSWIKLNKDIQKLEIDFLFRALEKNSLPLNNLEKYYKRVLYKSLVRLIIEKYPFIGQPQYTSISELQKKFSELDLKVNEIKKNICIKGLLSNYVPQGIQSIKKSELTQLSLLNHQIQLQSRHMPVRDLMDKADLALEQLMPCHMMSPSSVAQFVKQKITYDILIIDEASQLRPEEALGSLARVKQAIIVGDNKQLPPPNEFLRMNDEDQNDSDDYIIEDSILEIAKRSFDTERELLWHYRSKRASLITFSNRHFYNDRLIIFPSPREDSDKFGVKSFYVGGIYNGSMNEIEAQKICEAALEHMKNNPNMSLGIVALNQIQRDFINLEIQKLISKNIFAQKYIEIWDNTLEEFFVKNLENVQGDERDIIMISTVYGPDSSGNFFQRFRRINDKAGDRRLNVLFSRSKYATYVFTSIKPEQIRVDATTPNGTKLLRNYLEYAATGRLDSGIIPFADCDSDFELEVKRRLEDKGYIVYAQVGVAGYKIDLGVKHQDYNYGFLLGIECDGATYHSSKSARDRDKLRQLVLENLGWTIYRIWSTDWFKNQNNEVNKLVNFIENLLAEKIQETKNLQYIIEDEPSNINDPSDNTSDKNDYLLTNTNKSYKEILKNINSDRFYKNDYMPIIEDLIDYYVLNEGPINLETLARNVGNDHGFERTGSKIVDIVSKIASKKYYSSNEGNSVFFWANGTDENNWNLFRSPNKFIRKRDIDEISKFEMRALAIKVIQKKIENEEAILEMAKIGKFRLTSRIKDILESIYLETLEHLKY